MVTSLFYIVHLAGAYFILLFAVLVPVLDHKHSKMDMNSTRYAEFAQRFYSFYTFILICGAVTLLSGMLLGYNEIRHGNTWMILKIILFFALFVYMIKKIGKATRLRKRSFHNPWARFELIEKSKRKLSVSKYAYLIFVVLIMLLSYIKPF
jgi:ABC-type branched-subunit amino acid transport system permease subunit